MKKMIILYIIVTCMFIPSNVYAADIVKDFYKNDFHLNTSPLSIKNINDSNFIIHASSNVPYIYDNKLDFKRNLFESDDSIYDFVIHNDLYYVNSLNHIMVFDKDYKNLGGIDLPDRYRIVSFFIHNNKIYVYGKYNYSSQETTIFVYSLNFVLEDTIVIPTALDLVYNIYFEKDYIYFTGKKYVRQMFGFVKYDYDFNKIEEYFPSGSLYNTVIYNNGEYVAISKNEYSDKFGDAYFYIGRYDLETKKEIWKTRLYSSIHLDAYNIELKELSNGNYLVSAGSLYELDKTGKVVNSCVNCTNAVSTEILNGKFYSISNSGFYNSYYNEGYLEKHSLKYKLTLNEGVNGRYRVNRPNPRSGEKVIIKLRKENGYELDTIKVTKEDKSEVRLTKLSDKEYSFVMPEADTTIDVSYKKIKE